MEEVLYKSCVNCHLVISKTEKTFSLAAVAPTTTVTLFEIINYVFNKVNNGISTMSPCLIKKVEKRVVCPPCATSLKNAYLGLKCVYDRQSKESYIGKLTCEIALDKGGINVKQCSTQTEIVEKSITVRKVKLAKTPVATKMRDAIKNKRRNVALQNTIKSMIRKEIQQFTKNTSSDKFNDSDGLLIKDEILQAEMEKYCPLILKVMQAMFIKSAHDGKISPTIRTAICMAAYCQNVRVNGLQKAMAIMLYKSEAPISVYLTFKKMGICCSYSTVLRTLDVIRKQYDKDLLTWREGATDFLQQNSDEMEKDKSTVPNVINDTSEPIAEVCEEMDVREDEESGDDNNDIINPNDDFELQSLEVLEGLIERGNYGSILMRNQETSDVVQEMSALQVAHTRKSDIMQLGLPFRGEKGARRKLELQFSDAGEFYNISFAIDNLNKEIRRQDYSSKNKCKDLAVTSAFAIFNRIPAPVDEILIGTKGIQAKDIPVEKFLPGPEDVKVLMEDHCIIIKRILVGTMKIFSSLKKKICWCTEHEYSSQSCHASRYVNLGIFSENENTNSGMINIMHRLARYFPKKPNAEDVEVVCWGDCLSAERQRTGKLSLVNSDTEKSKLKGLIPGVSHWHKRGKVAQDDWVFLAKKMNSCFSRGTIPNFRGKFGHEKATAEFKNSFNENYKLLRFSTEAYVIAAAMKFLGFHKDVSKDFIPPDWDMQNTNKIMEKLDEITGKILDFEWHKFEKTVQQERYCMCNVEWRTEESHDYIGCDNPECRYHIWYHKSCLKKCQDEPGNNFNKPPGPGRKKLDEKLWFCTIQCQHSQEDRVCQYSRSLMFSGLTQEGYKSGVRANDGKRLLSYFRFHTIQLFNMKHTMYFKNCHNMLARLNGFGPGHIRNDLLNNSTVNWMGVKNHNIEIDLANEMLNAVFKKFLIASAGKLTETAVERRSQSVRLFQELKAAFQEVTLEETHSSQSKDYRKDRVDLDEAIHIVVKDQLLDQLGKRHHEGFEDFTFKHCFIDNIVALKQRISDESAILDAAEEFVNEYRTSAHREEDAMDQV